MLDKYHDKLVADLAAHYGDSLETVEAYFPELQSESPDAGLVINTPAVLVEIETLEDAEDAELGDGRDALLCKVTVHCVLGTQTENLQRALRNFAAETLRFIKAWRFSNNDECNTSTQPEQIQAMPGRFKRGTTGYDSWVVIFDQVVYLGEEAWKPQPIPHTVHFGDQQVVGDVDE